jgi:hypothetical protein
MTDWKGFERNCLTKDASHNGRYMAGAWQMFKSVSHSVQAKRVKKEGKAVPLQAWTGPEGSRRLRLPDF